MRSKKMQFCFAVARETQSAAHFDDNTILWWSIPDLKPETELSKSMVNVMPGHYFVHKGRLSIQGAQALPGSKKG